MLSVEKLATPETAATIAVPDSTPPAGFVAIRIVTVPVKLVTALPSASRAETRTAGAIAAPAVALDGCTVNVRAVAVPALMPNGVLVAPVSAPDETDSVYPAPALSMLSPVNVATPDAAATVVTPDSVPPLGLFPMTRLTLAV